MGGPVYRYDANLNSPVKFPASLNGRYFAGEYGRQWIKAIEVTSSGIRVTSALCGGPAPR